VKEAGRRKGQEGLSSSGRVWRKTEDCRVEEQGMVKEDVVKERVVNKGVEFGGEGRGVKEAGRRKRTRRG